MIPADPGPGPAECEHPDRQAINQVGPGAEDADRAEFAARMSEINRRHNAWIANRGGQEAVLAEADRLFERA